MENKTEQLKELQAKRERLCEEYRDMICCHEKPDSVEREIDEIDEEIVQLVMSTTWKEEKN